METPNLNVVEGEAEETEQSDFESTLTHTVLEVWQQIFSNLDSEAGLTVSPQAAVATLSSWPQLPLKDMQLYADLYYRNLGLFREVVDTVIEEHPEALKNVAEDAEDNHDLYVEILARWQKVARKWEDAWACEQEFAAASLAAMVDAINFTLSSRGLVAHLDQIGVTLTEKDEEAMQLILDEEE